MQVTDPASGALLQGLCQDHPASYMCMLHGPACCGHGIALHPGVQLWSALRSPAVDLTSGRVGATCLAAGSVAALLSCAVFDVEAAAALYLVLGASLGLLWNHSLNSTVAGPTRHPGKSVGALATSFSLATLFSLLAPLTTIGTQVNPRENTLD